MAMSSSQQHTEVVLRPLDSGLRASFEKLLSQLWEQNWSGELAQDILRWRYYQRPDDQITWLACVGGECVAMVDSRVRPYLLHGKRVMVRETADWFCLPEYRRFGLGLRVLRQLKDYPEPVVVVGGSALTRQILPRLGWSVLSPVRSYVLPITARGFAANLLRQKWSRQEALAGIIPRALRFRSPARVPAPSSNASIEVLRREDWHELPVAASSDLVSLLERDHWQWLASMPSDFARPLAAVFRLNGTVVGLSLSQLEPAATGLDGRIVHVQVSNPDKALIAWILSATTQMLRERGAEFVRCLVSTPEKIAAIESVGFMLSQELPCHWWNRPDLRIPGSTDIDYLRGDDAQPLAAMRGRRLDGLHRPPHRKHSPEIDTAPVRAIQSQA